MIKSKLLELKYKLELAGWKLNNECDIFYVVDDKIEWYLLNENTFSEEILTFCLFEDLGRRTQNLSDLFYVKRGKDTLRLYFDKKDSDWTHKLKNFVYTMR